MDKKGIPLTQKLHTSPLQMNLLEQVKEHVQKLTSQPKLSVILVGENPASEIYVKKKQGAAQSAGLAFEVYKLSKEVSQAELHAVIDQLNRDTETTGIILQLPLPKHLDRFEALNQISALKDVDGLTAINAGKAATEAAGVIYPATPLGVMRILKWADTPIKGSEAVVIGRSQLVGQPMALMLAQANATVTICHKETQDITKHLKNADIVVSATGCPFLVTGDQIKKGSTIIDVGISPNIDTKSNRKIIGDVCDSVDGVAHAVTPVPGGVGPMTVASLMTNVIDAAYLQQGKEKPSWSIPRL